MTAFSLLFPSFDLSQQRRAFAAILLAFAACRPEPLYPPSAAPLAQVANLHAFARLYGVVRWFHPSDAASIVDWDQLAADGVRRVMNAPDGKALRAALVDLFAPVAPTLQVIGDDETFALEPRLRRTPRDNIEVVAWEHEGYGDSTYFGPYASKRRHRARVVAVQGEPFAILSQGIDAMSFRGKRVRLRGKLRTTNHGRQRLE